MYAHDHKALFEAPAPDRSEAGAPLGVLDYDQLEQLVARGRVERSRQFTRLFNQAKSAVKRLLS